MDEEKILRDIETGEEFTYEEIEAEYERLKRDGETEAETIGDYIRLPLRALHPCHLEPRRRPLPEILKTSNPRPRDSGLYSFTLGCVSRDTADRPITKCDPLC